MKPVVFSAGRCLIGLFPYWIGLSYRRVGGLGRVIDAGFIKVAVAPSDRRGVP